ncbi:MAG: hypothetical protein GF390_02545, partial [Candidatus Pacebacteria bacterium]|nr:hypothetical protein [Candidatus Paceibacterota bacterium]
MRKNWWFLSWVLILAIAFGLRFYRLGQVPTGLYWDEVAMLVDAKSLAQTGSDMHGNFWLTTMFPSYGDYKLPVYLWLAAGAVKIFGVSEWALRLPSALAGVTTVIIAGWLAQELARLTQVKKLLASIAGLTTALIIAISPWSVAFSRAGFEGHLGQLLLASAVLLVVKAKKHWWLMIFAPVVAALATYAYYSVRFVWPVVLIVTAGAVFWPWSKWSALKSWLGILVLAKKIFLWLLMPLLIYLLCLIPMFQSSFYAPSQQFRLTADSILNQHDFALESNFLREQAGNTIVDRLLFHRHWLLIKALLKNLSAHLSINFLFLSGDINLRHGTGQHGLFLLPFLPFLFIGLYYLWQQHRSAWLILLSWWLTALAPASVPLTVPHALRSLNALVPLAIIIGFGLARGVEWLIKLKTIQKQAAVSVVFVLLTGLALVQYLHYYYLVYPVKSHQFWQGNYKQEAQRILTAPDQQTAQE